MKKLPLLFSTKIPENISEHTLVKLRQKVSPQRREKSYKFKFQQDALRSLMGELLLRYGLSKAGFENVNHLQFGVTDFGKPFLSGVKNIDFSISHSGTWVVAALSECAIGVDVENVGKIDLKIAEQIFTDEECKLINCANGDAAARDMFYRIWVVKESYVKAIGKGLSCPLNSFIIKKIDSGEVTFAYADRNLQKMFAKEYFIDNGYKLAVSCQEKMFPPEVSFVDFDEVIDTVGK